MVCSKCGFECGDSKFCPKCGTKLVKECKKCGKTLTDGDYCPNCGTKNDDIDCSNSWSITALVSFIVTIVLSALKIVECFTVSGSIHLMFNYRFFNIPSFTIAAIYAVLAAGIIVFSCVFRKYKKTGFGITAIALAIILKVALIYAPTMFVVIAGTIVHFIAVLNLKKVEKTTENN